MDLKYFCCFFDYRHKLKSLTDEEVGQLFRALMEYGETGEVPEMSGAVEIAFSFIAANIDETADRCREKSERLRENANKRWSKEKSDEDANDANAENADANDAIASNCIFEDANDAKQKQKQKQKQKNNDISPCRESETDSDFEEFWSAYPKKVGKPDAKKSFLKALKKTSLPEMIRAVEAAKSSRQWRDRQYIPNPSTWLNQERWNDELEPEKVESKPPEKRLVVKDSKLEGYASTIDYSVVDDMLYWGG